MLLFSSVTNRVKAFAHEHDDIPAFHAAYLVGTFLASALFNLGFFSVLIAGHMCLDYVKYRDIHHFPIRQTFVAIIRESLVDIALLLLSVVFILFFNHAFALAAMSGVARAEFTLLRAIGTLIPKIEILEHVIAVVMNIERYLHSLVIEPGSPLRTGEKWAIFTIGVSSMLILVAFLVLRGHEEVLLNVLSREFILAL